MFNSYKTRMNALGSYDGEAKRKHSQKIMEASWMRDTATKPVYVKWVNSGLPVVEHNDTPVYAKFNVKSYHNVTGDEVAYLLQFKQEDIKNNPNIKVGSYVQIRNEMDEPEWWIIYHFDDRPQFRQFSILKCLWVYKWVSHKDGKRVIHQCLGAPRNQNSYNSGEWLDYYTQVVENQHIAIMPSNDDANTIGYETKFLISNEGRYPPIAWNVSKVQPAINGAITRFTMTQEQFNPLKDNAELMIADYYESYVEPSLPDANEHLAESVTWSMNNSSMARDLEIVYSGMPTVRAGGGYKKFTLKEREGDDLVELTDDIANDIKWDIVFSDGDKTNFELVPDGKICKVKCKSDHSLIGKTFSIIANSTYGSKSVTVEVISL